jgi:hypothetical protein
VTAIIGPRSRASRTAADIHLPAGVLDRIDQIVTHGTVINPTDASVNNPTLGPLDRRRS